MPTSNYTIFTQRIRIQRGREEAGERGRDSRGKTKVRERVGGGGQRKDGREGEKARRKGEIIIDQYALLK